MESIENNLLEVRKNIKDSCKRVDRLESDVTLLAVTKTVDINVMEEALKFDIIDIGENKPQELSRKYELLKKYNLKWHLIGSLQRNKVKQIINKVYLIHSLDRLSLAEEIQKQADQLEIIVKCLIEVNISGEKTKHGMSACDVLDFVKNISQNYKNIKIEGLMTMAPFTEDETKIRGVFKELRELSFKIRDKYIENVSMSTLSMGMSHDYKIAIEEGATIVRVGTSIFGKRVYNNKK